MSLVALMADQTVGYSAGSLVPPLVAHLAAKWAAPTVEKMGGNSVEKMDMLMAASWVYSTAALTVDQMAVQTAHLLVAHLAAK